MTVFMLTTLREDASTVWRPSADIYRAANGWIVKFDLAGVRTDDIHVHVGLRRLTISGVRRDSMVEEGGCSYYSMEISYSRFERTVDLPSEIRNPRIRTDYRDGILLVRITCGEEERS